MYKLNEVSNQSTNMTIEGGYHDAENDNHTVKKSKVVRGMNYPCSNSECILTFSTKDELNQHLGLGRHVSGDSIIGEHVPVGDRVKQAWVTGLSGKVENRKTGLPILSLTKSLFSSTPPAIPNLAHCRALLYCRCVRAWGVGGVGLVVLVQ